MLKVFRDNLKYLSWVLWLVIAVFILFVFVDFGATVGPGVAPPSAAAAVVDGKEISWGEFRNAYQNTERLYRQIYGDQFSNELAEQLGIPLQVLNGLIADKILIAEAERLGLSVTDEELRDAILAVPAFQDLDGGFVGEEAYRRTLQRSGLTVDGWEGDLRQQLLSQKMRSVLTENLFVPATDVEQAYREETEKAKIRFIELTGGDLATEIALDEPELAAYFTANQEEFRTPERRVVDYLLIDRLEIQNNLPLGQSEIEAYYNDNLDDFRRDEQVAARHILLKVDANRDDGTARSEMEAVRRRIEAGEDFAAVAAELSEDPGSGSRGGDLGSFGRGQMVKPFEDAAFGAAVGELVGPVKSNFGYHLIEVLDRQPAGVSPLEEVTGQIRQQLLAERGAAAADSKARELADRIARENLGAEAWTGLAAEEVGVRFETSAPFARTDSLPGIGRATRFSVEAFELEPGAVSEPIAIGAGWAILSVKEIHEPGIPELDEVRAEVESRLRQERERQAALERATRALAELEAGKDLDSVAAALGTTVEETALFGRGGPVGSLGPAPTVAGAALELDVGALGGPVETDSGAVLFEVVERQHFEADRFAEEKASTLASLKARRAQELVDALVARRRDQIDVHFDPALLQNFNVPATAS